MPTSLLNKYINQNSQQNEPTPTPTNSQIPVTATTPTTTQTNPSEQSWLDWGIDTLKEAASDTGVALGSAANEFTYGASDYLTNKLGLTDAESLKKSREENPWASRIGTAVGFGAGFIGPGGIVKGVGTLGAKGLAKLGSKMAIKEGAEQLGKQTSREIIGGLLGKGSEKLANAGDKFAKFENAIINKPAEIAANLVGKTPILGKYLKKVVNPAVSGIGANLAGHAAVDTLKLAGGEYENASDFGTELLNQAEEGAVGGIAGRIVGKGVDKLFGGGKNAATSALKALGFKPKDHKDLFKNPAYGKELENLAKDVSLQVKDLRDTGEIKNVLLETSKNYANDYDNLISSVEDKVRAAGINPVDSVYSKFLKNLKEKVPNLNDQEAETYLNEVKNRFSDGGKRNSDNLNMKEIMNHGSDVSREIMSNPSLAMDKTAALSLKKSIDEVVFDLEKKANPDEEAMLKKYRMKLSALNTFLTDFLPQKEKDALQNNIEFTNSMLGFGARGITGALTGNLTGLTYAGQNLGKTAAALSGFTTSGVKSNILLQKYLNRSLEEGAADTVRRIGDSENTGLNSSAISFVKDNVQDDNGDGESPDGNNQSPIINAETYDNLDDNEKKEVKKEVEKSLDSQKDDFNSNGSFTGSLYADGILKSALTEKIYSYMEKYPQLSGLTDEQINGIITNTLFKLPPTTLYRALGMKEPIELEAKSIVAKSNLAMKNLSNLKNTLSNMKNLQISWLNPSRAAKLDQQFISSVISLRGTILKDSEFTRTDSDMRRLAGMLKGGDWLSTPETRAETISQLEDFMSMIENSKDESIANLLKI